MPSIPKSVWLSVGVLMVLVVVLWSLFWKKEFKLDPIAGENNSLSGMLNDFFSQTNQGKEKIKQLINRVNDRQPTNPPPELIANFVSKVDQQLWLQRIADWQLWSNQQISFKLPANWLINEDQGKFIITSFNELLSLKPADRVKIEISFIDNKNKLTPAQWQDNWAKDEKLDLTTGTSTAALIGALNGLNLQIYNYPGSDQQASQFIFLPKNEQMIQLFINLYGNSQSLIQTIEDFKKTIEFK